MLISYQTEYEYRAFLHNYRMNLPDDDSRRQFNLKYYTIAKCMLRLDVDDAILL